METIDKTVKATIENLMIDNNIKEAIKYAISKGVTPQEFVKIAGKDWKD